MSEFAGTIRLGERVAYYVDFPCSSGSAYISGTPTVAVRDFYSGTVIRLGTAVTGMSGTVAGTPVASPRAWWLFDTVSPGTVPLGWVSLCFQGSVVGSDGMARVEEPKIDVLIVDAWGG